MQAITVDRQVPELLQDQRRWVTWSLTTNANGRPTRQPKGSTARPGDWSNYWTFDGTQLSNESGLGFVTTAPLYIEREGAHLIALDLDACVHADGTIDRWAVEVIEKNDFSYTELSPSGTGLRQWILVSTRPTLARSLVMVAAVSAAPPKKPQLQVFGAGPAGYVTVTGKRLKETSETILDATDGWNWLVRAFELDTDPMPAAEVPNGSGPVPSLEELSVLMRAAPDNVKLVEGHWQEVTQEKSASEAYHLLVHRALKAANGHGEVVIQWLLTRTAWGRGAIDNSRDPGKYSREKWVRKDVARAARNMVRPAAEVFSAVPLAAEEAPVEPAKHGRLVPVSDLWDTAGNDPFLLHGVLPRRGIARMFGDPGCGKTPLALSLAIAVSTGAQQWLGHDLDQHGKVVYLVGEDRAGLINRCRAEAMRLELGKDHFANILFSLQPGQLLDATDVTRWIDEVTALSPEGVPLLVVDTQSRNFNGDENSSKDMALFVHHLTAMSERLRCLVLLVHHTGLTSKERARGSIVALGGLDAELRVEREGMEVRAIQTKAKNWATPDPLVGTLKAFTIGQDRKGRPLTAVTLEPGVRPAEEVFRDLEAAPGFDDGALKLLMHLRAHQGEVLSRPAIAGALQIADGTKLRRRLELLEDELGMVTSEPGQAPKTSGGKRGRVYTLTDKGLRALAGAPEGSVGEPDRSLPGVNVASLLE